MGDVAVFAPALVRGALVAGAAVLAGTVLALLRLRRRGASADEPSPKRARSPSGAKRAATLKSRKKAPGAEGRSSAKAGTEGGLAIAKVYKARTPTKRKAASSGDDASERGPRDASRIAMGEDYEVRYWTKRFGVDRQELQRAVDTVGNGAEAVERELARS